MLPQTKSKNMNKREALRRIADAFSRLGAACDHTHTWDRYVAIHRDEERDHRKHWKPDSVQCGLTRSQSIHLFCVKSVFERFVPGHSGESIFTPEAKDFFHVKLSVFGACSLAHECRLEIAREFSPTEMSQWLASVDYVALNRDPRQEAA